MQIAPSPPEPIAANRPIKIVAHDVNVRYGAKHVLKHVDIAIAANEITALIGASGCGKSTFLRCMNRMNDLIDTARVTGELLVDGEDIYAPTMDVTRVRMRMGMIFDRPRPFPKTVYDNIAYGPRIHRLARDRAHLDEIVTACLERAGLLNEIAADLFQPATRLSNDQQQRLCIARAIAVDPDVILMDAPCAALDPVATARIEEVIDDLRRDRTVVIVAHSRHQAARVAQRTAFFHQGELIEMGDTGQIFTNPRHPLTQGYITGRFG